MRKVKYKLIKYNQSKIYLKCMSPLFEYASEICDNCSAYNENKLE